MVCIAVAAFSITASAQRAGEYNLTSSDSQWSKSGVFLNVGAGAAVGDVITDLGASIDLGYRYHFGNGFCWDIFRVSYYNFSITEDAEFGSSMRFLTGFRYNSVPLLAGKPLYGTFQLGYQMNLYDTEVNGFAYEIGAGVLLTPTVSLGLVWEGNTADFDGYYDSETVHYGIIGLKLGINF